MRKTVLGMLCGLFAQLAFAASGLASPPQITIERTVEATSHVEKPWLVVYVFDKSGSMLGECAEDPTRARRTNWAVVTEDAQQKLAQLQSSLSSFDLRLYLFGTKSSEFARPYADRPFSIATAADVSDLQREIRTIPVPRSGESTNLWNSLASVFEGIQTSHVEATHAGVIVVVFSDGADDASTLSTSSETRFSRMKVALAAARATNDIQLSVLPIGEWKRVPERLKQLGSIADLAALGDAIKVPLIVNYSAEPVSAMLDALPKSGASASVQAQFKGFDRASASKCTAKLRDATAGFTLATPTFTESGGALTFTASKSLDEGASAWVMLDFIEADGTLGSTAFKVVVPSYRKVAPITAWGLPPECAALNNRRVVVLTIGEPLNISLSVPTDSKVTWTVDGAAAGEGPTLRQTGLSQGIHDIKVTVSTADEKRTADASAVVIDPKLSITGPSTVRAGDAIALSLAPMALPAELSKFLTPPQWTVQGTAQMKGERIDVRFDRRGSERVVVTRTLNLCARTVNFAASSLVDVKPGPALRLVGGELVRRRVNRIEATLSGAEEISKVLFVVDGKVIEGNIDAATSSSPATAWIRFTPGSEETTSIEAIPILKDDRGLDRLQTDVECKRRAQMRSFSVFDPDVSLVMQNPKSGEEKSYGYPFDIRIAPEGRDAVAIARVEVKLVPASGEPIAIALTRSGDWSATFKPNSAMGSQLQLQAQAFDESGAIGLPVETTLALVAPKPALALGGAAKGGAVQWSGRNENPPSVIASIVIQGTEREYAASESRSITWRAQDDGLVLDSTSNGDRTAIFTVKRAGTHGIRAIVTSTDGKQHDLDADIACNPMAVVPSPQLLDPRLEGDHAISLDHSATTGAWVDVVIRVQRSDGAWMPLSAQGTLDPVPTIDEPIKLEAWYRPWGAPASATPWDQMSGWIESESIEGVAFKPHSMLLLLIAIAGGLVLIVLAAKVCFGHQYWGAIAQWHASPEDGNSNIRSLKKEILPFYRNNCHGYAISSKKATITVLPIQGRSSDDPEFGWIHAARRLGGGKHPSISIVPADGTATMSFQSHNASGNTASLHERGHGRYQALFLPDPSVPRPENCLDHEWNPQPIYLEVDLGSGDGFRKSTLPIMFWIVFIVLGAIVAGLWFYRII